MSDTNAAYWARRCKQMEDAIKDRSYEYVQNLERQYEAAIASLDKEIRAWYQRIAANNGISYSDAQKLLTADELEEFHWTVQEYIRHGKENGIDVSWAKELENASARVHISRLESLKLQLRQKAEELSAGVIRATEKAARLAYAESYHHTAYEFQRGIGVGWTMHGIDERRLEKVLSRPWAADGKTFTARCWTDKTRLIDVVGKELTRMIATGEAPDRAIAAIAHQMGVSKRNAGRIFMTESAYFASASQKDCFNDLVVEQYVVVGTLDRSTCELCGAMDGKVFPMSKYEVGSTAPPFHPWCRCCTAPYFEDMKGVGERFARDPETGKTYTVPRDMTYKEWKAKQDAKYGANTVDNKDKSGIIKSHDNNDYYVAYPERFSPRNNYEGSSCLSADLKNQLSSFENKVRDERIETALVITANGESFTKTIGSDHEVTFTYGEMLKMNGGVMSHNHSNGSTFTAHDISMLFQTELSEIRACNTDGAYVLRLPIFPRPRPYSVDEIEKELSKYEKQYKVHHVNQLSNGRNNLLEYDYESQQYAVEKLAKKYGCDYYFERRQ